MQTKEKKWIEIEHIMEEYAEDDEELREKFRELKVNIRPGQKISNVVYENEKLKYECKNLQNEIKRMRKILLNPDKKFDKFDDRIVKHNVKTRFLDSKIPEQKVQVVGMPDENDALKM